MTLISQSKHSTWLTRYQRLCDTFSEQKHTQRPSRDGYIKTRNGKKTTMPKIKVIYTCTKGNSRDRIRRACKYDTFIKSFYIYPSGQFKSKKNGILLSNFKDVN